MDRSERAAWDTVVDAGEVSLTVAASVVVQPLGSRVRAVAPDVMTWSKENLSTLVGRSITLRGTTRAGRCYPGLVDELAEANHLACTWAPLGFCLTPTDKPAPGECSRRSTKRPLVCRPVLLIPSVISVVFCISPCRSGP
jgi:hypothetical protein